MENIFKDDVKRVLAPLVGGSDLSYRLLCRKYGAQVTYTEMCIAEYYINKDNKKLKKYTYEFDPADRPLILQLAGNTADPIIELANNPMFEGKIDGVDLNCGCPQGFALEKGYGCAMMRDEENLVRVCEKIVQNVKYPVSVKLRLHESIEKTVDIITRLRDVGVRAFTVHGRFYWQKGEKRGTCDWDAIRVIKERFPDLIILGNGDANSFGNSNEMIQSTKVNAAMSGYGALLNPSIFSPEPLPLETILYDYLIIARVHRGLLIDILRHVAWILKGHSLPLSIPQKEHLFSCKSLPDLCDFLSGLGLNITLPDIPSQEDKITYPKSRDKQSNKEKKREVRLDTKSQQKKLKKEKHQAGEEEGVVDREGGSATDKRLESTEDITGLVDELQDGFLRLNTEPGS